MHGEVVEEGAGAPEGPVDHLVGDDEVPRRDLLAEAARRRRDARMCVTPSDFSAQMLARYGTVDGLRRCPSPWRERSATGCPSTSASVIGPEGGRTGVVDLADLAGAERAERLAEPRPADHPDDAASHRISLLPDRRPGRRRRGVYRGARRVRPRASPATRRRRKEKARRRRRRRASRKMRQRPTLPHGFPCSTIGSGGLNFRVRDGNGCDPTDIATAKLDERAEGRSLLTTEHEG